MSLFPIFGDNVQVTQTELPLYRDVLADPVTGLPVFRGGSPVIVEGLEALRVWIATAIRTPRCRHGIYSWNFGCELDSLVGRVCSPEVKTAEAPRMVREALLVNPYITDVRDITVEADGDKTVISATIQTIYGEVGVDANQIV